MHQSSNREIEGASMNTAVHFHTQENNNGQSQSQQQYQESQNDDFLEQMLSTIPNCSWPPTPNDLPSPTSNPNTKIDSNNSNFKSGDSQLDDDSAANVAAAFQFPFDDPTLMSKLEQQQQMTEEVIAKSLLLQQQQQQQQQFLLSSRTPAEAMLSLPLSLGNPDSVDASAFKSQAAAEASVQALLYNGLAGSLHLNTQPDNQHFHPPPPQGGSVGGQKPSASKGGINGAEAPQRQRVRARRGQATDPHSIAERLRRERIAERMKALQELVPNANKIDKASMLDEIIDYVKFLQLQVKVLSMSRLGGASAVAPPVTDMTSEGVGRSHVSDAGNQTAPTNDGMIVTEHQVAKLMEEDMGSAMQYLQGKGLCLMPISLASAISPTPTSRARPPGRPHIDNNGNHHHRRHNFNDNNIHHHPLYPAMPASNGEGDPTPESSIQDPSAC